MVSISLVPNPNSPTILKKNLEQLTYLGRERTFFCLFCFPPFPLVNRSLSWCWGGSSHSHLQQERDTFFWEWWYFPQFGGREFPPLWGREFPPNCISHRQHIHWWKRVSSLMREGVSSQFSHGQHAHATQKCGREFSPWWGRECPPNFHMDNTYTHNTHLQSSISCSTIYRVLNAYNIWGGGWEQSTLDMHHL